jgi:hypothetical protein
VFLLFGQSGGPPGGLSARQALEASEPTPVPPLVHGLGGDVLGEHDVATAVAIRNGQERESAFDVTQLTYLLSGVEWAFEFPTKAPGDSQTHGTHGDSRPQQRPCPGGGREYPEVGSRVKASSEPISKFSVPRKIFFLKSID